jgi:outer membrane receptor for ferric coprogen and ferric-rhodotorulic acid
MPALRSRGGALLSSHPSCQRRSSTASLKPMNVSKSFRVLCFVVTGLHAQTAPNPATRPAEDTREKVIELSPFVITSDQDTGYLAASTLAGSRLNTPLKDTAASISVLTSEFLSDIGAFDISEAMHYSVNVEYQVDDDRAATPNGNESVANYQLYRVRGLSASLAQNYFNWRIPV